MMLVISIASLLAACDSTPGATAAGNGAAQALELRPADERVAALYEQSCRACHAIAVAGAPRTGDRAAWDVRWQKGLPSLVANTVNGFNAMPPRGQCFSCSPADYEALIAFMSGREATLK